MILTKKHGRYPWLLPVLFYLADLCMLLIAIAFLNYTGLPSLIQALVRQIWFLLMFGGFVIIVVSVLISKTYTIIRNCIYEAFILTIYGIWLGIARSSIVYVSSVDHTVAQLFMLASCCMTIITVIIHTDMFFHSPIKHFLTNDHHFKPSTEPEKAPVKALAAPSQTPSNQVPTEPVTPEQTPGDEPLFTLEPSTEETSAQPTVNETKSDDLTQPKITTTDAPAYTQSAAYMRRQRQLRSRNSKSKIDTTSIFDEPANTSFTNAKVNSSTISLTPQKKATPIIEPGKRPTPLGQSKRKTKQNTSSAQQQKSAANQPAAAQKPAQQQTQQPKAKRPVATQKPAQQQAQQPEAKRPVTAQKPAQQQAQQPEAKRPVTAQKPAQQQAQQPEAKRPVEAQKPAQQPTQHHATATRPKKRQPDVATQDTTSQSSAKATLQQPVQKPAPKTVRQQMRTAKVNSAHNTNRPVQNRPVDTPPIRRRPTATSPSANTPKTSDGPQWVSVKNKKMKKS